MKSGIVLQNSVSAVVTGGSSGIGLEFARQLAGRGYALMLVSNQEEQLTDAVNNIEADYPGVMITTLCKDLSEHGAANVVVEACNNFPPVEVLVNNAGIFSFKPMVELTQRQLDLYFELHMRAVTELSLAFAREMQKRGKGYILNMSSMSCWMPMPGIGMYAATKSYIRVMSRSLYLEMKESGVHVMVACPGGIATDLFGLPRNLQKLGVRLGALATPQKFVKGALNRLFRNRKQYINGLLNRIAIVAVAMLPTKVRLIVKHRMLDNKD
ncbi:MAG: SDR family NAD(P)-dependent oxidoreductase [Muribaculaceae bacterium]|nr:SDR family NAD(P)-dependent oxidoreductase [Muribaculaceae bacterium]